MPPESTAPAGVDETMDDQPRVPPRTHRDRRRSLPASVAVARRRSTPTPPLGACPEDAGALEQAALVASKPRSPATRRRRRRRTVAARSSLARRAASAPLLPRRRARHDRRRLEGGRPRAGRAPARVDRAAARGPPGARCSAPRRPGGAARPSRRRRCLRSISSLPPRARASGRRARPRPSASSARRGARRPGRRRRRGLQRQARRRPARRLRCALFPVDASIRRRSTALASSSRARASRRARRSRRPMMARGVFRTTFTFLQGGRFDVAFTARADGSPVRGARAVDRRRAQRAVRSPPADEAPAPPPANANVERRAGRSMALALRAACALLHRWRSWRIDRRERPRGRRAASAVAARSLAHGGRGRGRHHRAAHGARSRPRTAAAARPSGRSAMATPPSRSARTSSIARIAPGRSAREPPSRRARRAIPTMAGRGALRDALAQLPVPGRGVSLLPVPFALDRVLGRGHGGDDRRRRPLHDERRAHRPVASRDEPDHGEHRRAVAWAGQTGLDYLITDSLKAGLAVRGDLVAPAGPRARQVSSCDAIGDCPTLHGAVAAFELGVTVGYRIPL